MAVELSPAVLSCSRTVLGGLMPMFLRLDDSGRLVDAGPTLRKLIGPEAIGRHLAEVFVLIRPKACIRAQDLTHGGPLRLNLRGPVPTGFKGIAMPLHGGGVLMNLSFSYGLREAVRDHGLSDTDFAATDLAFELLFLAEANAAIIARARRFSEGLNKARAQALEQALTDPLTGLHNRRGLDRVVAHLQAEGRVFALIHVDLDHFKRINDTLGHAAGDLVLKTVARRLRGAVRDNDSVARIGGDEVVVLLSGMTDKSGVELVAKRIVNSLAEPVSAADDGGDRSGPVIDVSASLGVVVRDGGEPRAIEELLVLADQALYRSKDAGRGRFTFAGE